MSDTVFVRHSKHSKIPKKNRGQPNMSHLLANNKKAEPPKKNIKSSVPKRALTSLGEVNVDISAAALALKLGFEQPYEKITIKSTGNDRDEETTKQVSPVEIIEQLIDYLNSCKCNCLSALDVQDIACHCMEIILLDRHSRDFFIMGLLRCGAVSFNSARRHSNHTTRNRYCYRLMNTRICQRCFLAVNNIGSKYLKNLKKHFAEHGVTSRLHGNHGRKPHHAISSSAITDVVEFVNRYASSHGIPAARRPKNPRAEHIIRLPPSDNITSVHKKYKEFYEHCGKKAVALTSFRKIWSHHLPHIKLTFKEYTAAVKNLAPCISMQESEPNVDINPQHSSFSQAGQIKIDTQDTNTLTQSMESQTAISQKSPVNLPYEYSGEELPHNQILPLNLYMPDGGNHDTVQFSYLFPQTSMPSTRIQTVAISSTAPATDNNTSMDDTQDQTSLRGNQDPSFPSTVNSPVSHVVPANIFNPPSDKNAVFYRHGENSGYVQMAQISQENPTTVYDHTTLTTNTCTDTHQESSDLVRSGLTTLSQQIRMSLFQ